MKKNKGFEKSENVYIFLYLLMKENALYIEYME